MPRRLIETPEGLLELELDVYRILEGEHRHEGLWLRRFSPDGWDDEVEYVDSDETGLPARSVAEALTSFGVPEDEAERVAGAFLAEARRWEQESRAGMSDMLGEFDDPPWYRDWWSVGFLTLGLAPWLAGVGLVVWLLLERTVL